MRVHVSPRVVGRKDTISVLEIEFTSKARRVKVRGSDRMEPLDLTGARTGGSYDVSDVLPRVHVPLRVMRDGPGRAHLYVTVEDGAGGLAPESWEGDVVLDAPPVAVENRRTALLLGVFTAVVGAIVWFVGIPLLRARNPRVPVLAGLSRAAAEKSLKDRGIAPVVLFVKAESDAEIGTVLAQSPAADIEVDRNSTVTISVARGVVEVGSLVPSLVGLTEAAATAALAGTGFRLDTVDQASAAEQVGRVIQQAPLAALRVPAGARIQIVVGRASTPNQTFPVPLAMGKTRHEAETAVQAAGLVPLVEVVESTRAAEGSVFDQSPARDTMLAAGSTVTLRVAKAPSVVAIDVPKPPTVPSIPPVAIDVPKPPTVPSIPPVVIDVPKPPTVPSIPPVVIDVPKPPTVPSVPPVAIDVPKPPTVPSIPPVAIDVPKPPTVPSTAAAPDVLGLSQSAAEAAVRAAGLEPRAATEDVDDGDPEGLVLRQEPLAGDRSSNGLVALYVGRRGSATPTPSIPPIPSIPWSPPPLVPPSTNPSANVPSVPPAPPTGPTIAMPDVLGLRIEEAARRVGAAGLVLGAAITEEAEAAQRGLVLSQEPVRNTRIPKGATVRLSVGVPATAIAQAPKTKPMPRTNPPTTFPAPPRASNRPATGPIVAAALGAETRRVPDFAGRDAGDAIVAAIAEGFVPTVVADRDARAAQGRVRVQSVVAGTPLPTGSRVTLSIGGGYAQTMVDVPVVVGMSTANATAALARVSIRAEIVPVRARPGVFTADGQTVVAQTPAGWVTPPLARSVRLYVVVP